MFKVILLMFSLSVLSSFASDLKKFDHPTFVIEGIEYSLAIADIQDILYGGPEELEMDMVSANSFCKLNGFNPMDDFQGAGTIKSALHLNDQGTVEYIA